MRSKPPRRRRRIRARREERYKDLPEGEEDHCRDWFRIGGGYASGRAGIAILLTRGVSFMKLGPSDLDLTSLGQDPDKPLLADYTETELIEKERRERFLAAMDQSIEKMLRNYNREVAMHLKEQEKAQAGSAASEVEAEGKAGDPGAAT